MVCRFIIFLSVILTTSASVVLLFPKGFSISVEDEKRSKHLNFHVNITRNDGNLLVGTYTKNVNQFFGTQFTFARRNVALNVGDSISYRVVSNTNGSTQVIKDEVCYVKELPTMGMLRKHGWMFSYDLTLSEEDCGRMSDTGPVVTAQRIDVPDEDIAAKLNNCQQAVFNASLSILALQFEVEELRNLTQEIKDFEETYPLAKQLTLSGRIPPDGDAVETVRFMLYEKLNLSPAIVSAFRESPYNIRFTVSTVLEKFRVLETAKFLLQGTRIQIS
ncbi:hypothetical protein PPYR_07584 [Photinus pyralis]|uniref:CBM39 domain-containing protein n=1 Tax=Photinus pyralis TaxID=7054 RepID=A0A5N4AQU0_PHOPY|nr:uncharacterized protein LOC116169764 [Photinus pyralis]KAB0799704.1 hypothetical protein PPYR_07584 [Photinus pyralis]